MMNTVVIVAIAAVLLLLIVRLRPAAIGEGSVPGEFLVRLPPTALLWRCISVDDVVYVSRLRSPALSDLLFRERRRLALMWLDQTRREGGRLYRLHLRMSARAADLQPLAEVRLLFHFVSFWFVYQILISVVWLYGPVRAQVFVSSVRALAGVLAGHVEQIAAAHHAREVAVTEPRP